MSRPSTTICQFKLHSCKITQHAIWISKGRSTAAVLSLAKTCIDHPPWKGHEGCNGSSLSPLVNHVLGRGCQVGPANRQNRPNRPNARPKRTSWRVRSSLVQSSDSRCGSCTPLKKRHTWKAKTTGWLPGDHCLGPCDFFGSVCVFFDVWTSLGRVHQSPNKFPSNSAHFSVLN